MALTQIPSGMIAPAQTFSVNGITFPATQVPSADANTLDDYEEGTWTPSLGGNTTYNGRYGYYTKIGNSVVLTFYFNINSRGTGSQNIISGLPWASGVTTAGTIALYGNLGVSLVYLGCYAETDSNIYLTGSTTSTSTMTYNGSGSIITDGSYIYGAVAYRV
jgi:hypothetical protein